MCPLADAPEPQLKKAFKTRNGEYAVRQLIHLEAATRLNPRQPNLGDSDIILDSAVDESGFALVTKFTAWTGDRRKQEANVFTAARL